MHGRGNDVGLEDLSHLNVPSAEALRRLVYLVGPARGGTSIILNCLRFHPKALVLDDNHFLDHVWRHRNKVHGRLWRIIFHLPYFFDYQAILRALPEQEARALGRYVNESFRRKEFARLYQLYPLLHALDASNDKDPSSVTCWCDKSTNWRGLGLIRKRFPEAKFVFIARDPRAMVLSHARRAAARAYADDPGTLDPAEVVTAALHWRMMMLVLRRFTRRHPGSVTWVRYEDFVAAPAETMHRLYDFAVGEPMGAGELAAALEEISGGASNDPEHYRGISQAPLERWRSMLTQSESDLIAEITGGTARALGYDIEGPGRRSGFAGILAHTRGGRERLKTGMKLAAASLLERAV